MKKDLSSLKLRKIISLSILTAILSACQTNAPDISLQSMLEDMTNRELLSSYPSPYYSCSQFSSYDQNTVAPDEEGWFANHDASWFIRQEENQGRREFVMLDANGPGAIVRFWMTFGNEAAYTGTIRFYFDGSETPEIEGPVLDIMSGGALAGEPLSSSVSPETNYFQRGHNLYLPIPYSSHLKITYECEALDPERHSPSVYYNIDYRTWEEGVNVVSFSMDQLQENADLIKSTLDEFTALDYPCADPANAAINAEEIMLSSGEAKEFSINGKKAVRKISLELQAGDLPQALRSTVMEISFDGSPSVWVPVGDFFGTGYQIRPYKTWYTEVTGEGHMSCWWVMPFKKEAKITLTNYGEQDVELSSFLVWTEKHQWNRNSMHFGARWHELNRVESGGSSHVNGDDGHFDVNYVTLEGHGVYAGTGLTVFNTADAWWGEGDEKIWVDGESFPSFIGTGTEDYFGYAWCRPEKFSHFLIAQPDGSGNFHPGMSVNLRFYILDAMPFSESLRFDLELWHWAKTVMNYAPTTFWYMKPGGEWNIEPDIETVKKKVALKRSDLIDPQPVANGMLEGENLRVIDVSHGNYQVQNSSQWGWSGNSQLWWIADSPEASLKADFLIEEAGEYNVKLTYTKAIDYGDFRIGLNDRMYPEKLSGYHNQAGADVITKTVNMGTYDLVKGENTLNLVVEGKNPGAVDRYMVGIDLLKLEKTK